MRMVSIISSGVRDQASLHPDERAATGTCICIAAASPLSERDGAAWAPDANIIIMAMTRTATAERGMAEGILTARLGMGELRAKREWRS